MLSRSLLAGTGLIISCCQCSGRGPSDWSCQAKGAQRPAGEEQNVMQLLIVLPKVRIEDERAWEGHSDFCPLKMEQRKKMSRLSAQLAQDLAPLSPRGASLSPRGATLPSGGNRMPTPSLTLPLDVGEPPTTLFGVRARWDLGDKNQGLITLKGPAISTYVYGWCVYQKFMHSFFSDIERYSRIAFPLAFFTFHFMYWTILCSISEVQVDDLVPLKIV